MLKNKKKNQIEKILFKVKPILKKKINDNTLNLINDGILDSFDILKIILELEKLYKKKINMSKISRKDFYNIKSIMKLYEKI